MNSELPQNMSLVKVKNRFQVTIPAKVRKQINLEEGDMLEVSVEGDTIILKPQVVVDRDSYNTNGQSSE